MNRTIQISEGTYGGRGAQGEGGEGRGSQGRSCVEHGQAGSVLLWLSPALVAALCPITLQLLITSFLNDLHIASLYPPCCKG